VGEKKVEFVDVSAANLIDLVVNSVIPTFKAPIPPPIPPEQAERLKFRDVATADFRLSVP
jgi:hypothetical protein